VKLFSPLNNHEKTVSLRASRRHLYLHSLPAVQKNPSEAGGDNCRGSAGCTAGFVTRAERGRCRSDPDGQSGWRESRGAEKAGACFTGLLLPMTPCFCSVWCLSLRAASGTRHHPSLHHSVRPLSRGGIYQMVYVLCLTLDHVMYTRCPLSLWSFLAANRCRGGRQSAGETVKRIRGGDMARFQARWLASRFAQLALALFLCSSKLSCMGGTAASPGTWSCPDSPRCVHVTLSACHVSRIRPLLLC
jgi:hypothetical protein